MNIGGGEVLIVVNFYYFRVKFGFRQKYLSLVEFL